MNLTHRIRMALLLRRADQLVARSKRAADYLNRPHQQSVHMIGYPMQAPAEEHSLTFVHILAVVLVSATIVYGQFFHSEPGAPLCAVSTR